jgi:hypothetical protein
MPRAARLCLIALIALSVPLARAGQPLVLFPPDAQSSSGPTLSLGRVGPNPCPGGLCYPEPHSNLFYFMTKGTRRIEPVPGFLLRIPFGDPH